MYKIRTEHYNIEHVLRCLSLFSKTILFTVMTKGNQTIRSSKHNIFVYLCLFPYMCVHLLQEFSCISSRSNFFSSFFSILFLTEDFPASSSSSLLGILSSSASRLSRESPWPEFPSVASLKNGRPSRRSVFPPSRVPGSFPGWLSRPPEAFAMHPMIQSSDDHFRRHHQHPLLERPFPQSVPGNLASNPAKIRIISLKIYFYHFNIHLL